MTSQPYQPMSYFGNFFGAYGMAESPGSGTSLTATLLAAIDEPHSIPMPVNTVRGEVRSTIFRDQFIGKADQTEFAGAAGAE